jgi:hypothetical protein
MATNGKAENKRRRENERTLAERRKSRNRAGRVRMTVATASPTKNAGFSEL